MDAAAERWRSYLTAQCRSTLEAVREQYPSERSVTIDLIELHSESPALVRSLFDDPDTMLSAARSAVRELVDTPGPIQIRIENNPHWCGVPEVSSDQLYDLVTVEGTVESVDATDATVVTAVYDCPACGTAIVTSPAGVEPADPVYCDACEWGGPFEFRPERSEFLDTQHLSLGPASGEQDAQESLDSLSVYLHGALVGRLSAGAHVGVTGVLRARRRSGTGVYALYLDGYSVRAERDLSPPASLGERLDTYWED